MTEIKKFPDSQPKPITILSVGHPQRERRTVEQILPPLFTDPLSRAAVAYWLIAAEDGDDGVYNCQRAYNDALWECASELVVYSTGDSLIPPSLLWRAYGVYLEARCPVFATRADQVGEGSEITTANNDAIGDFILTPREWAIDCGGWDERLPNWGLQDYVFCAALDALGHAPIILGQQWGDRVIHLWHPRKSDTWYREQNEKNRRLVNALPPWTKMNFLAGRVRKEEALAAAR